jgi:hypothetical protein
MTTIGTAAALIALALIAARIARRSVLRYRGGQHINELVVRSPAARDRDDVEARSQS